ncbi:MAG: hypothetical protein ACRCTP_17355 [Aeromonas popoffii]|uniref:hypothetical protein n=1 Tax=Aeromonas popoffii TaxID=70856 RepID=UPI003F30CEBA
MVAKKNLDAPRETKCPNAEVLKEMEELVPENLWAAHSPDMGSILSASPVIIKTKPGDKLPRKYQYPLRPEAIEGIRETIEGLVTAGV